jgi:biotin synthase-like enzyme
MNNEIVGQQDVKSSHLYHHTSTQGGCHCLFCPLKRNTQKEKDKRDKRDKGDKIKREKKG